jgi:hypothetical protein
MVPTAPVIAFLANPKDPELTPQLAPITDAAHALGCRLVVVHASTQPRLTQLLRRFFSKVLVPSLSPLVLSSSISALN